jgi:hypothetical protein
MNTDAEKKIHDILPLFNSGSDRCPSVVNVCSSVFLLRFANAGEIGKLGELYGQGA